MVQVTRSIYGILLIIVPFLLFSSIIFDNRCSVQLRWFLLLLLIGCCSLISFGAFVYIQFIYNFMFAVSVLVVVYMMSIKMIGISTYAIFKIFKDSKILNIESSLLCCFSTKYIILFITLALFIPIFSIIKLTTYNIYTLPDINTLKLTALNYSECSSINITCTSSVYNITYKKGVDFTLHVIMIQILPVIMVHLQSNQKL